MLLFAILAASYIAYNSKCDILSHLLWQRCSVARYPTLPATFLSISERNSERNSVLNSIGFTIDSPIIAPLIRPITYPTINPAVMPIMYVIYFPIPYPLWFVKSLD